MIGNNRLGISGLECRIPSLEEGTQEIAATSGKKTVFSGKSRVSHGGSGQLLDAVSVAQGKWGEEWE